MNALRSGPSSTGATMRQAAACVDPLPSARGFVKKWPFQPFPGPSCVLRVVQRIRFNQKAICKYKKLRFQRYNKLNFFLSVLLAVQSLT